MVRQRANMAFGCSHSAQPDVSQSVIHDFHNGRAQGPRVTEDLDTFLPHRGWLVAYCRRHRLTAGGDAEDLAQQVFEKIQQRPTGEPTTDPRAYLKKIARNLAIDEWRKTSRRPEVTSLPDELPLPREEDGHAPAADTWRLVERAKPYLTPRQQSVFDASLKVADKELDREQAAAALGITPESFSGELRRLRDYVETALVVVLMIEQSDCRALARLAKGERPSHQFGRTVHNHIASCRVCQGRKPIVQGRIRKAVYVAAPIGLFGLASQLFTAKKIAVAAAVVATGCLATGVLVFVKPSVPDASGPAQAVPTSSFRALGVDPPAAVPIPEETVTPPSVISNVRKPSTPNPRPTAPIPAPSLPASPSQPSQPQEPRDDLPPTVIAGRDAIEHSRIATKECKGRRPARSMIKVAVTSRSGVESVRMSMRVRGVTVTLDMVEVNGFWFSAVGPFAKDMAGHDVEVTVTAVGKNKQRDEQYIGRVRIVGCGE
jgi:RNA polymerase sigma factor (sigma-70 family)